MPHRIGPQSSERATKQARKDEIVGGREQKKLTSRKFERVLTEAMMPWFA